MSGVFPVVLIQGWQHMKDETKKIAMMTGYSISSPLVEREREREREREGEGERVLETERERMCACYVVDLSCKVRPGCVMAS